MLRCREYGQHAPVRGKAHRDRSPQRSRRRQDVGVRLLVEPKPFAGFCPCEVHDPADDGTLAGVVRRGFSPDVVKDVDGQVVCRLPGVDDSYDEAEYQPVGALVQLAKRTLVSRGHVVDEDDPVSLGQELFGLVCVQHVP